MGEKAEMIEAPLLEVENGIYQAKPGHLITAVTYLKMTEKPEEGENIAPGDIALYRASRVDNERYRAVQRRVGADYLWISIQLKSDAELTERFSSAKTHLYYAVSEDEDVGVIELHELDDGVCEIAYFGLAPEWTGRKAGPWMMREALKLAWSLPNTRMISLHTCTFDHPKALGFYRHMGFKPFRMGVEIFEDPRISGVYSKDAAPQIPLMDGSGE